MAIVAVPLTEQRLQNLSDEQIAAFLDRIPVVERCVPFRWARPDRKMFARYVRDETLVGDSDEPVRLGLGATALLAEGTPFGMLLHRRHRSEIEIKHWLVPLRRLDEVRDAMLTLMRANGITRLYGDVRRRAVRGPLSAVEGVSVVGIHVELLA